METRSSKRRKEAEEREKPWSDLKHESGDDIISNLPDELLHQILLLLPINSVVKTSILSKRWRSILRSLPDLDFTSLTIPNKARKGNIIQNPSATPIFDDEMDPISNVLGGREKNSILRRLRFCARLSFTRLNDLIRSAVRRNVQELDIEVYTDGDFNLPRCIFTSDTLRFFKLKAPKFGFHLPPASLLTNGFRSLQEMSLSHVVFRKPFSLNDLFVESSFPLLRKLSLEYCNGLEQVRFSCRGLEELVVQKCFELRGLEVSCVKLKTLIVRWCEAIFFSRREKHVYVNGPKLERFEWENNGNVSEVRFENLGALEKATMVLDSMDPSKIYGEAKLLAGVSNVTCLSLDCRYLEMLSHSATSVQPFYNLRSLELHIGFRKMGLAGLSYILSKSPFVENLTLVINSGEEDQNKEISEWLDPRKNEHFWDNQLQLMKSFLEHVKVVNLRGFRKCEDEVLFVFFLLMHARNLEKMVYFRKDQYQQGVEILRAARARPKVVIE